MASEAATGASEPEDALRLQREPAAPRSAFLPPLCLVDISASCRPRTRLPSFASSQHHAMGPTYKRGPPSPRLAGRAEQLRERSEQRAQSSKRSRLEAATRQAEARAAAGDALRAKQVRRAAPHASLGGGWRLLTGGGLDGSCDISPCRHHGPAICPPLCCMRMPLLRM